MDEAPTTVPREGQVSGVPEPSAQGESALEVCLVGGPQIVREGIVELLAVRGVGICNQYRDDQELAACLAEPTARRCDVCVLILCGHAFDLFHRVMEVLQQADRPAPLLVLSDKAGRAQVYTALRLGAKAYVDLDVEPDELVKAIRMAAKNRVYLAPDVTELLVNDISQAWQRVGRPRKVGAELSKREMEIVQLLCDGLSSKEIGRELHISVKTVENHRYNTYRKCEVTSIAGLMRFAIQRGLVAV